jgi:hypothetical protein
MKLFIHVQRRSVIVVKRAVHRAFRQNTLQGPMYNQPMLLVHYHLPHPILRFKNWMLPASYIRSCGPHLGDQVALPSLFQSSVLGMKDTMLQFLLLVSIWCFASFSTCVENKHKRYLVDSINIVQERQASATPFVTVLGIKASGVDTIQPRLEIRELERRPDVFNVFLLGLQRFQNLDQSDKLSYYQVAGTAVCSTVWYRTRGLSRIGIHGRPFISWDGVQAYPPPKLGYCRHSSNIFPTWHRPYLALVEVMQTISLARRKQ